MEPVLGVNIPGGTNLAALEGALARIAADGWQAAELNLSSCPLIMGGQLQEKVVEYMKSVMARYPLHYTAHVSYGLNLRAQEDAPLHHQVMLASLEACAALEMDRLNFHYEEHSHDHRLERQFLDWMREACDLGQELGVRVNIENVEVEDVRYALDAVKALDHPNCGMTLDLGHLWLSAHYFGYDYLPAVAACAPYVRHLHVNDNNGTADQHLMPFHGTVDWRIAMAALAEIGYKGELTYEIQEFGRYLPNDQKQLVVEYSQKIGAVLLSYYQRALS